MPFRKIFNKGSYYIGTGSNLKKVKAKRDDSIRFKIFIMD